MNSVEMNKIFKQVFVCFPSFKNWYDELPSKAQTYEVWTRALATANYVDCLEVLDQWTSGSAKPPAGFEREQTIYKLAAAARDIAAERDRRAANERTLAQADRSRYQPLPWDRSMKAAYTKILTRLDDYKEGRMTWSEYQDWCKQCASEMS